MQHEEALHVAEAPVDSVPVADCITLRNAVKILGGYAGTMRNPKTGVEHSVDLTTFRGRDLDSTYLTIAMNYVDPSKVGTKRFS